MKTKQIKQNDDEEEEEEEDLSWKGLGSWFYLSIKAPKYLYNNIL